MKHAVDGLKHTFKGHSNFSVHLIISSIVVIFGLLLGLSPTEWLIVIALITTGLMMELVNTAIESVVDLITQEWRLSAKIAKDTSAAAMLIFALGATVIALIIFIPKIVSWLYI